MLLINKPKGMTSHDVVDAVRKATGHRRVGHAGTLDPLAEGLLLVLVGKEETRRAREFLGLPKEYEAKLLLGQRRDTGDMEGIIMAQKDCRAFAETSEYIAEVVRGMVGVWQLPVPKYSAVKVDGVPLHRRVRRGEQVVPPVRAMAVYEAELLSAPKATEGGVLFSVRFVVASGVYIRSLVEELGERLDCPATLFGLCRTRIGEFHIADAITLAELKRLTVDKKFVA